MELKIISTKSMQVLALTGLMIKGIYAEDVSIIGSIEHILKQPNVNSMSLSDNEKHEKIIQLLRVRLSDEEKTLLEKYANEAFTHTHHFAPNSQNISNAPIQNSVRLGMNKVPVLDQGIHGTCVTFAVTGALDAVLAQGDYISQLCNLQLGSYLEKHGDGLSGWDGSYASYVINQIEQFGIVNMEKQHKLGCGGMTEYPINSAHNPESSIEPEIYSSMSELIFGKYANWFDVFQKNNPEKNLDEVKQALQSQDRLVFAVMLPRTDLGFVGAVGKYKTWFYKDTWLLTPEILSGINNIEAAHEMIITGYDDDAVAVDDHGLKHKGLLILRNSWGTSVGDYGEFYMSYDYFKLLSYDLTRLSPASI